jgi:hypothetical protein
MVNTPHFLRSHAPQAQLNQVPLPRVSADGKRVILYERTPSRGLVVVDGREGKPHEDRGSFFFSADGAHAIYAAQRGGKWFPVVDGEDGKPCDGLDNGVISADGNHVAFAAYRGDDSFLLLDGQEGKAYDSVRDPCFSRDGQHVAFIARQGSKWFAVVDGKEGAKYGGGDADGIASLCFSPSGGRVAYLGSHVSLLGDSQWCAVVDGQEGRRYDKIESLRFGPDGKRVAYIASRDKNWRVVVDEVEGEAYDEISPSLDEGYDLTFSADIYAAYAAQIIRRREGTNLTFSPDSKHFAYAARSGKRTFIVVDEKKSRGYDLVLRPADDAHRRYHWWPRPVFDGPNLVRAIAYRDGELIRAEIAVR